MAELIDSRIRVNKFSIACKVDFEKAFDNMNWNFLDVLIERFSFGLVWRSSVKWSISYARFSILINGEGTTMFRSQKGIRHGDPISSFLFILVVELLSLMIQKETKTRLISGIQVAENGTIVNLLQFADNLVVFLDDSEDKVVNLKNVLFAFELVASLKVNFRKSAVVGIGGSQNDVICANVFGCQLADSY